MGSKLNLLWDHFRFYVLDAVGMLFCRYAIGKGKLLLVRLDAIGDFVVFLDSAKEYRRLYPEQKIILCANSTWVEIARAVPYWDEVWAVDVKRLTSELSYRFETVRKIRRAGFEIAIQPTFSRVFLHGDSVIRVSGAMQRIGSVGDPVSGNSKLKLISDRWYTALIPAAQSILAELERNAEFIRNLSGQDFEAKLPVLETRSSLPDRLKISADYFIVFPGASWKGRQWPRSNFVEVIRQLHQNYGWLAVVCGGPSEKRLCQSIVDQCPSIAKNFGGATSLPELLELLRGARLLISNETSAVHLATAVSTPVVCILGGGHFGRFLPYPGFASDAQPLVAMHKMDCYNCNWICRQKHDPAGAFPCVSGVAIEDVTVLVGRNFLKTSKLGVDGVAVMRYSRRLVD